MRRKVIEQGNGTLTITLPKKWTKEVGLSGESEVEMRLHKSNLVVDALGERKEKEITVNVDNFERLSFAKFLISCYELGFDSIDLRYTKATVRSWSHDDEDIGSVISYYVSRLIGFEILGQTSSSIKIGNLSEKHLKFDAIVSRIFFIIEENLKHLNECIDSCNLKALSDGEQRHDNCVKLIALTLREIGESETMTKQQSINYAVILNLLDKVVDFIRYAYKYAMQYKGEFSNNTYGAMKYALDFFEGYRRYFNKFDYKYIADLDEIRGSIKNIFLKAIKSNSPEAGIVSQFDAIVETLHGAIKPRIIIEIEKEEGKE
ncbi:phosphate uptake regulator PhoU [Candidatus Woesearchaeota archaeon]|nr:phosphate uptake regulator PhoU [Candidatus Woesearchaeota archaeon]